jgi:hypothetical protein
MIPPPPALRDRPRVYAAIIAGDHPTSVTALLQRKKPLARIKHTLTLRARISSRFVESNAV